MLVNEAIIDVAIGAAKFRGEYSGGMPRIGCPMWPASGWLHCTHCGFGHEKGMDHKIPIRRQLCHGTVLHDYLFLGFRFFYLSAKKVFHKDWRIRGGTIGRRSLFRIFICMPL
jgi:hypothetical protein